MAKRRTKQQKDAEEKAALKQRIDDMVAGACGEARSNGADYITEVLSLGQFGQVLGAIKSRLLTDKDNPDWMIASFNFYRYDTVNELVDFLHHHGVRA